MPFVPITSWTDYAAAEEGSAYVVDFLSTTEGLHLNRAFARIQDPKVRKRIVDLVTTLAGDDEAASPQG